MAEPATAKASPAASTPAATRVLTAVRTQGASPKASGSARDSRIRATVIGPPLDVYHEAQARQATRNGVLGFGADAYENDGRL
jgi:hypothetical protein